MRNRLDKIKTGFKIEEKGAIELLDHCAFSFLLSRQSRRPHPDDWWVNAVRETARWVSSNDAVTVTGGGLLHLDFARWAAHLYGPVVYVDINKLITVRTTGAGPAPYHWCDLRLLPKHPRAMPKKELLSARDELVAALSDALIAIAVRKGGAMERIGLDAISNGKKVFALEPPSRSKEYGGNWNLLERGAEKIELEIHRPAVIGSDGRKGGKGARTSCVPAPCSLSTGDYLWHFTRECQGPWPGETWETYFADLAAGAPGAGHSALDSLARILSEERIRACGRMIRGGFPVVCWSGAEPGEFIQGRRYRSALVRWEFQPYAIGIGRDVAQKLGLSKVICLPSGEYSSIIERDRYLFQARPDNSGKFSVEEEWRNFGDFPLTDLHPSEGAALVKSPEEAAQILPKSRFPVISLAK